MIIEEEGDEGLDGGDIAAMVVKVQLEVACSEYARSSRSGDLKFCDRSRRRYGDR